jgi:signal transduction histidine kinase
LHQRDAILEAVAYAAETFMKTTDWQNVIQDVLAHLGAEIGANHAYIFQAERDGSGEPLLSMQYEWVAQGDAPDIGNPRFEKAPAQAIGPAAWFSAMQRGEPYYGSRSTLPPDEIQFMDKYSIQSYLDMPIQVGQEFWGIIGFENSLEEKDWGEAEIDSLKVAASVLGAAIQRQQTDLAIRLLNFELEQRVQERTAELESANRELESFAYSVSHDLRTPLRGIDGYSKLLRDDYASLLDQQGREYLENVIRATTRMADLINDLLKLSRVTRTEMHRVVVNLSDMAEELLEEMRQREPQRRVEVHVQEGLQAYGDPNLLRLALNNLLGNAWKFTSHTASARIEVGAQQNNGRTTYYVSDNGVGFDMKFKDKLFVAFQRLHSASEFEGTGVGLATVQRVITRHSGQIWAEGRLRQGAAFYFTLPGPGMGD